MEYIAGIPAQTHLPHSTLPTDGVSSTSLTVRVWVVLPLHHPSEPLLLVGHEAGRQHQLGVGGSVRRRELRGVRVKLVEHLVELPLH